MKKTIITLGLALSVSVLSAMAAPETTSPTGADAANGSKHRGDRGDRPKPPLMLALDPNGDHVIDASEITNAPEALKKLDLNGDGKLTRDEIMPPRPEGKGDRAANKPGRENRPGKEGGKHRMPPLIAALDANADGVIDSTEITSAADSLKKLDKNGDGKITKDEAFPPRPEGSKGRGAAHTDAPTSPQPSAAEPKQ